MSIVVSLLSMQKRIPSRERMYEEDHWRHGVGSPTPAGKMIEAEKVFQIVIDKIWTPN